MNQLSTIHHALLTALLLASLTALHAADRNETTNLAAQNPDQVKRLEAIFKSQLTPNTDYPMYPPKKKAKP